MVTEHVGKLSSKEIYKKVISKYHDNFYNRYIGQIL